MSEFAPSVARAKAAGYQIEIAPYPEGATGIKLSLEKVAQKIRFGRNDPDMRGWAGDVIIAAGRPTDVRSRAQAIMDAFRAQTWYTADPVGSEMIASGAATLCLRPGLCVRARDCDDSVVAVGSALASIGIPVRALKQYFGPGQQEHVLLEAEDESGRWFPLDPSTDKPVGFAHRALEEVRIDPMNTVGESGTTGAEIVTLGRPPVGLGAPKRDVMYYRGVWWERRYGNVYRWDGSSWQQYPTGPIHGALVGVGDSGGMLPPGNWTPVPSMQVKAGLRYALIFGVAAKPAGLLDAVWNQLLFNFLEVSSGPVSAAAAIAIASALKANGPAPVTESDVRNGLAPNWLVESVTKASEDSTTHVTSWVVQAVARSDQTLNATQYVTFTGVYRQGAPNNNPPGPPPSPGANQDTGVGILPLLGAGLAVGAVGGVGYYLWRRGKKKGSTKKSSTKKRRRRG